MTTLEWIDIFTKQKYFKIITDSLTYCRQNKGLKLYEYIIMTNHLHIIVSTPETNNLPQVISDFKKHTTRKILELIQEDNRNYIKNIINNSYYKKKGYTNQIWQRENYPEAIYTEKFLMTKIKYMYMNPVKKGYVAEPEHWQYSSARNWMLGKHDIIQLDPRG